MGGGGGPRVPFQSSPAGLQGPWQGGEARSLGSTDGLSFLLPFSPSRITVLPSGVLQIYSVEQKDAGSYRCVATTVVGRRRSGEATLTVVPGIQKILVLFEHCCQQTVMFRVLAYQVKKGLHQSASLHNFISKA